MKNFSGIIILLLLAVIFIADELTAIPAFARKYNMSCKTCHSPFPYLKEYGEEFAGNGFTLSEQEAPRYYVETGDPELNLLRDVPLAFRIEAFATYNQIQTEELDFSTPLLFKLLTGGSITKDVAYYVYYILEKGERGLIEDAWVMFNNVLGSELDITVGQFQVSDPLFKRELRLMRDDYQIYKVKPFSSRTDLTYDRGIMLAYGLPTGTDLVFEVVNGNGIGEMTGYNLFDKDEFKNIFGRISQGISDHFRIGAMGYLGKEGSRYGVINKMHILGADATINFDPLELNVQYVQRKDGNPSFLDPGITQVFPERLDIETRGGFAELLFRPAGDDSKYYLSGLFNFIESDQENLNYKTVSAHFGYLLSRNFRLVLETRYDLKNKFMNISGGFVTAF
jgi:hypothetical protein